MGAFKTGFHIGVCCKDMDTAIAFMSSVFNEPEHKKFSPYDVQFKYDNGDLVEWIKPTENARGKKFDFIFCNDTILYDGSSWYRDMILRPMLISPDIRVSHIPDSFNENNGNKFTLLNGWRYKC
jgi:hypothetical protein